MNYSSKIRRPYKVRKSFEDTKTQAGCYALLESAINKANDCPGYSVYDGTNGKLLYPINPSADKAKEIVDKEKKSSLFSKVKNIFKK